MVMLLTLAALVGLPVNAAWAHGAGQAIPDAAYYRSSLVRVTPPPPGVSVRVDPAGEFIELVNTGTGMVVILGYMGEPYLRITSTAVAENLLSQTAYLNRNLFADSVPSGQDAGTMAPSWHQIGSSGKTRWHDHRIHWMGQQRPPAVQADPRHAHLVGAWQVHATVNSARFDIQGELRWIGKPNDASGGHAVPQWVLWMAESMAVVIGVLVLLLARQRHQWKRRADGAVHRDASHDTRVFSSSGHTTS
jgi:hypothetical protein